MLSNFERRITELFMRSSAMSFDEWAVLGDVGFTEYQKGAMSSKYAEAKANHMWQQRDIDEPFVNFLRFAEYKRKVNDRA